jgi:hypothetical protein
MFPGLGGLRPLEEKKDFKCSAEFVTPPQMESLNAAIRAELQIPLSSNKGQFSFGFSSG